MNKIQINDKYWIISDIRSWNVSEYLGKQLDKATGKERDQWKNYSYHPTFDQAVNSLCQRLLREASTSDISGLRAVAVEIKELMEKAAKQAEIGL